MLKCCHALLIIPHGRNVQYCSGGALVVSHAVLIIPHRRICTVQYCTGGAIHVVQYSATSRCINKHGGICIVFPAVCNLLLRDVQSHFITAKYSLYIA